ncbi:MAG TPA: AAA family ATPase, partial [Planctomycetaceae bacterium]|nr:AAA family ATPase [Planctomycetaceae bacterium]
VLSYNAESEGQTPDTVIEKLIEETPLQQTAAGKDGQYARILKS